MPPFARDGPGEETGVRTGRMRGRSFQVMAASLSFLAVSNGAANAQSETREGKNAFGGWQADKPGTVRLIRPNDLPQPGATASAVNFSRVVARPAGAMPQVPAGFRIELFAEGLSAPRVIRVAPNGDIFVAETRAGRIRVLRAADGAEKASSSDVYASGLNEPFGIAFFPSGSDPAWVYVANTDSVVRFPYPAGTPK